MVLNKIMGKSIISKVSQISIPTDVRDYLGVTTGDSIIFYLGDDGRVYIKAQEALKKSKEEKR